MSNTPNNIPTPLCAPSTQVEPYRPFPVDVLPEPLCSFVIAAAKAMVCDVSYIALPLLVVLAAAIGSTRRLVLKHAWTEPAILWGAVVGESGTTKTPALRLVFRLVRQRQHRQLEHYNERVRQYEADLAQYESDLEAWKRRKRSGGTQDEHPPEKPAEPHAERCIVDDITTEAVVPILSANPRGVLLACDELSGWLASFDRYTKGGKGGGDAAHWLPMHSGEPIVVDRRTGMPRTLHVPHAYVSLCGGIQPGILNRALGIEHRESGLAARLLLTFPPRQPKQWTDADIDPHAEAELAQLLERLYDLKPATGDDGQPIPVFVQMTPDAKKLWVQYYNAHNKEQVEMTGELAAAWSKLEGCAARLALIIHYARWAAGDVTLENPDRVDADSMSRALILIAWFKHETRRVYGMLAESDEQRERRQLVEWIASKGGEVSARDLQQGQRAYKTADAAEARLQELVKAGLGTWQSKRSTAKGGRPSRVFRLSAVPVAHETQPKPKENGCCVDVDSVDTSKTQDTAVHETPSKPEEEGGSVGVDSVDKSKTQDDEWWRV